LLLPVVGVGRHLVVRISQVPLIVDMVLILADGVPVCDNGYRPPGSLNALIVLAIRSYLM